MVVLPHTMLKSALFPPSALPSNLFHNLRTPPLRSPSTSDKATGSASDPTGNHINPSLCQTHGCPQTCHPHSSKARYIQTAHSIPRTSPQASFCVIILFLTMLRNTCSTRCKASSLFSSKE